MKRRHLLILLGIITIILGLYIIFQYFSPASVVTTAINVKKFGRDCEYAGECGNIIVVNCHAEVDGPLFYVDKETEEIIEYCGGYCMGGTSGIYCRNCPPKNWDCD
jgi:hypothetical protein